MPFFVRNMCWKRALGLPLSLVPDTTWAMMCSLSTDSELTVGQSKYFLLFKIYYLFKLHLGLCVHECWYPRSAGSPKMELQTIWHRFWGPTLGLLLDQCTLLTTESSLQPQTFLLVNWISHVFAVIVKCPVCHFKWTSYQYLFPKGVKGGGVNLGFKISPVTFAKGEVAFNNEEEVYWWPPLPTQSFYPYDDKQQSARPDLYLD